MRPKRCSCYPIAISGVTGPIVIIFAHDVATILPLNIFFQLELPYSNPFQNASLLMKVKVTLSTLPEIGCHGNVSWRIGKYGPDQSFANRYLSFDTKIAKIGPVNPEITGLRALLKNEKEKEINASKIYSPPGKFAERAKQDKTLSGEERWRLLVVDKLQSLISIFINVHGEGSLFWFQWHIHVG